MRSVAGLGLLAIAGCNQVFGLDETATKEPDVRVQRVTLSQQVALADEDTSPIADLVVEPLEQAPVVRVGELDQPLVEARYVDGEVEYPEALVGEPWRLEYTLPGGVPHEVQWQPPAGSGHLVVPIYGRMMRTAAAPGTGYRLTLPSYTFSAAAQVFTTGYWTKTAVNTMNPPVVDLTVPPLSGPLGAPIATDAVVALDYEPSGECTRASTAGTSMLPPVQAGAIADVTLGAAAKYGGNAVWAYEVPVLDRTLQLAKVLTGNSDGSGRSGPTAERVFVGHAPHDQMFAFTHELNNVPAPVLVPLIDCPPLTGATPNFTDPGVIFDFPAMMFAYTANARTLKEGATLTSSIASISPMTRNGATYNGTADLRVPIAAAPIKLGTYDLADGVDEQEIANVPTELTFTYADDTFELDYVEVTLYRVDVGALRPVRVYTLANPARRAIAFDPSVMVAGAEHVFAIRTYRGRPDVRIFDFTRTKMPQVVATIFTRSFKRS